MIFQEIKVWTIVDGNDNDWKKKIKKKPTKSLW